MNLTTPHQPLSPEVVEMATKGLYDVDGAALWLGISRRQAQVEMSAGRLRSVKIGRLRRVPAAALREYVADLERRASA